MNAILVMISPFAPPLRGSEIVSGLFPHAEARGFLTLRLRRERNLDHSGQQYGFMQLPCEG